ncbi:adenylate/guanylate cyclase domain-containing protein [Leptospira tipperaryensis]|nr:adenylate/guanylate cyclase domain-containing protein [Leptospira tipperaryensis]
MIQNYLFKIYETLSHSLDRNRMSNSVREILEQEERNGAIIVNRFRYGISLFFLFLVFGTANTISDLVANLVFLFLFLGSTVLNTWVLAQKKKSINPFLDYASLFFDFFITLGLPIYFSLKVSPENFAHVLKNPSLFLLIVPIALTALQFRIKLVLLSMILFLVSWSGLIFIGLKSGVPLTNDWKEYILGSGVILSDLIFRPIPFLILGFILSFTTYRAISMIRRIGNLESRRASLARFFSPSVVEELSKSEGELGPGVRQKVTILFSDIRNFTRMSEEMDPVDLAKFLTDFRNRMTDAIFESGGSIDKFIGDAIMGTFGTPKPSTIPGLDSNNAVKAGKKMLAALKGLNSERAASGLAAIEIGIGVHTGEVFCGTIGSEGRMEYTVIGDAVNTASRIESLCKFFESEFLVSEEVYLELNSGVDTVKMPPVQVKGKEQKVQVYKLSTE